MRRRWPLILLGVLLALVVSGVGAFGWVQRRIDPPGPRGRIVHVTVKPGMTTDEIGRLLEAKGVIEDASVWRYYVRAVGVGPIQAGDYSLHRREKLSTVVELLKKGGRTETDTLVVPEGLTLREVADRVGQLPGRSADRFLQAAGTGEMTSPYGPTATTRVTTGTTGDNRLEGLLFPDTYFVDKKEDERRILARMLERFTEEANQLGYQDAQARVGVSPYQAIVVASLVEKEAKVDDDRAMIARVIYNRLAQGIPLQVDATVLYALGEHKERVLLKDLEVSSPYNTYKVKGLPPGPIANPGRESLDAAMNPTPGPWLYYVLSDVQGRHAFANTLQEFNRLKAEAQAKGLL